MPEKISIWQALCMLPSIPKLSLNHVVIRFISGTNTSVDLITPDLYWLVLLLPATLTTTWCSQQKFSGIGKLTTRIELAMLLSVFSSSIIINMCMIMSLPIILMPLQCTTLEEYQVLIHIGVCWESIHWISHTFMSSMKLLVSTTRRIPSEWNLFPLMFLTLSRIPMKLLYTEIIMGLKLS